MVKLIFSACLLILGCLALSPAHAANLCTARPASDAPVPLPAALIPRVKKAFDLHNIKPKEVQQLTVSRCMDGHVYACFVGANLPCGKADTATHKPDITAWCKENQNADFVPAYVTGHDSAYNWGCTGGLPHIQPPSAALDARGFFTDYWRKVD